MFGSLRSLVRAGVVCCVACLFSSCATIMSASRYTVPIHSRPSGASLRVLDRDSNMIFQGTTPAVVELRAAKSYFKRGIYTVWITDEDHEPFTQELRANVTGWYWVNLLIGNILGLGVIDPLTGAMYSLKDRFVMGSLHPTSTIMPVE